MTTIPKVKQNFSNVEKAIEIVKQELYRLSDGMLEEDVLDKKSRTSLNLYNDILSGDSKNVLVHDRRTKKHRMVPGH